MKIVDWFKNLLSRTRKKDYMLNENNVESIKEDKTSFVPKVDTNTAEPKKSREDILMSLREDIIIEDLSAEYDYARFSNENIKAKYDKTDTLSQEDITAIGCLYSAITEGNRDEFNGKDKTINNNINEFLKQKPNNIVVLINLMIKDAKQMYENLGDNKFEDTTIQGLIACSYADISKIIEDYNKANELEKI